MPLGSNDPFGDGFFGGRDPFAEFGSMMPFGGGGLGGGFGGGMGDMMKRFDAMQNDMMRGFGDKASGGGGVGGRMANMGNGSYACQSFAMCSRTGPDGKQHVEKYSSSDTGNTQHKVREGQQAYSNSSSGMQKMGLERQVGDQARKMVKERNSFTQEERTSEMFRGMDESGKDAFDRNFASKQHHMPQHLRGVPDMMPAGRPALGNPGRGAQQRSALCDRGRNSSTPANGRRR